MAHTAIYQPETSAAVERLVSFAHQLAAAASNDLEHLEYVLMITDSVERRLRRTRTREPQPTDDTRTDAAQRRYHAAQLEAPGADYVPVVATLIREKAAESGLSAERWVAGVLEDVVDDEDATCIFLRALARIAAEDERRDAGPLRQGVH